MEIPQIIQIHDYNVSFYGGQLQQKNRITIGLVNAGYGQIGWIKFYGKDEDIPPDEFDEIKICVAYKDKKDGTIHKELPSIGSQFKRMEPVYKVFPGWKKPTYKITSFEELPAEAKRQRNRQACTAMRHDLLPA